MNISVLGTGYVGLVTGACLAELGNRVLCMDIDRAKIDGLRRGQVPIFEPGLSELVARQSAGGNLHFTTDLPAAVRHADIIFLALPTPPNQDGSADISRTLALAPKIAKHLQKYTIIVNKSTVPVGTTAAIRQAMAAHATVEFDVVSNPEFLREGRAVDDCLHPNLIVVGSGSDRAGRAMQKLYRPLAQTGAQFMLMDEASAELAKYALNTMLAAKISMMNELANVCELAGADITLVRQAVGTDPRIGPQFLNAGIGYGGSCFPKDVRALISTARRHGYDMPIAQAVTQTNLAQRRVLVDKLTREFGRDLRGKTFAMWGLAFKPQTDDLREAPALVMIDELVELGARVRAFDPVAGANARQRYAGVPGVEIVDGQYAALDSADALVIATEWPEFSQPDFAAIKKALARPLIFDGRNMFAPQEMQKLGFGYVSIGRAATAIQSAPGAKPKALTR